MAKQTKKSRKASGTSRARGDGAAALEARLASVEAMLVRIERRLAAPAMRVGRGGGLAAMTLATEGVLSPPSDASKDGAIASLDQSIAAMKEAFNLLSKRRDDPTTTLNQERRLLQEMGHINAELFSQEALRLHLLRMQTIVTAPTDETGKQLAAALGTLEEMKKATADFVNLMDLLSHFLTEMGGHRREVDERAD